MNATNVMLHAFAMERAIRAYLASIDRPTIPIFAMSGRNNDEACAPVMWSLGTDAKQHIIILPDMLEVPSYTGIEVKTQGYAPIFRMAGVRTTGFKRFHYEHYRLFEEVTGRPVSVAFCHLCENEIRGGTLDDIEPARTDRVNLGFSQEEYWEYDLLPVFFPGKSLSDVLDVALKCDLGRDSYTPAHDVEVRRYMNETARVNAVKHSDAWGYQ